MQVQLAVAPAAQPGTAGLHRALNAAGAGTVSTWNVARAHATRICAGKFRNNDKEAHNKEFAALVQLFVVACGVFLYLEGGRASTTRALAPVARAVGAVMLAVSDTQIDEAAGVLSTSTAYSDTHLSSCRFSTMLAALAAQPQLRRQLSVVWADYCSTWLGNKKDNCRPHEDIAQLFRSDLLADTAVLRITVSPRQAGGGVKLAVPATVLRWAVEAGFGVLQVDTQHFHHQFVFTVVLRRARAAHPVHTIVIGPAPPQPIVQPHYALRALVPVVLPPPGVPATSTASSAQPAVIQTTGQQQLYVAAWRRSNKYHRRATCAGHAPVAVAPAETSEVMRTRVPCGKCCH
jgi:hypothetical protein